MKKTIDHRTHSSDEGIDNILELENPNNYRCLVHHLARLHAGMRIDLRNTKEKELPNLYVFLQNIYYFQGPLSWVGANFSIGSNKELSNLFWNIRKANEQNALEDYVLSDSTSLILITIKNPNLDIKVITTSIIFSTDPNL